ncbi:MAG: DUF885 domain-containing protein, partial [Acidobacteria bacterium]
MKIALALFLLITSSVFADDFDTLARDFWNWRAAEQPVSGDDIPRIDRPANWMPKWAQSDIAEYKKALSGFEDRWKKIDASSWPVSKQVDYRLIGSGIARVRWELEVLRSSERDPLFYTQQSLGAVFLYLVQPAPFDESRTSAIVLQMKNIPQIVEDAKRNLNDARAPFAQLAIEQLKDVRASVEKSMAQLKPH